MKSRRDKLHLRVGVHTARVLIFCSILGLIHLKHKRLVNQPRSGDSTIAVERLQPILPGATKVEALDDRQIIYDGQDRVIGMAVQTSPAADHISGFSGPTNVLVVFDADRQIVGLEILESFDTRDHVQQVREAGYLKQFVGRSWETASQPTDAVSGATLTSLAIADSIAFRLDGAPPSSRFSYQLSLQTVQRVFADAASFQRASDHWKVWDSAKQPLGRIFSTSPSADRIIGYGGPTDTLIGVAPDGKIVGIAIGATYDNEQWVAAIRDDVYFRSLFNGKTIAEMAQLDLFEEQVEGVSGATMTSQAMAEGLVKFAADYQAAAAKPPPARPQRRWLSWRDLGTISVVTFGAIMGLTRLRSRRRLRLAFQIVLIVYLGWINGDLISQAMLVGWAQNGIPWRSAFGLVFLTAAALVLPVVTRMNIYCQQICPHGAVQQLIRNRLPWKWKMSKRTRYVMSWIPGILLALCVLVPLAQLPINLIDLEPFDAWVWGIAGVAAITIAIVGLAFSAIVPMGYCRYGCPTGALLNYLRFHAKCDQWNRRDWLAVGLLAVAVVLSIGA